MNFTIDKDTLTYLGVQFLTPEKDNCGDDENFEPPVLVQDLETPNLHKPTEEEEVPLPEGNMCVVCDITFANKGNYNRHM